MPDALRIANSAYCVADAVSSEDSRLLHSTRSYSASAFCAPGASCKQCSLGRRIEFGEPRSGADKQAFGPFACDLLLVSQLIMRDRYVPDSDDEYEPAPSPRHRPSDKNGNHKGKEQHRSSRHHQHGSHKSQVDKHGKQHREALDDDVEDGEIVSAEGDDSPAAHAAAAAGASAAADKGSDKAGLTTAAASNGNHRYPVAEGSAKEGSSGRGR